MNLDQSDDETVITLPATQGTASSNSQSGAKQKIRRVFVDPTGLHLLISTTSNDNYYFYSGWPAEAGPDKSNRKRAKILNKLKGIPVDSVAWASRNTTGKGLNASSTKEILLGTADGRIFETWLEGDIESGARPFGRTAHDRYLKPVLLLQERQAVLGLRYQVWQRSGSSKRRLAIIATTSTRILQFCCAAPAESSEDGLFEIAGQVFKETAPSMWYICSAQFVLICMQESLELPGDTPYSELHFWQPVRDSKGALEAPRSVAWSTGRVLACSTG